MIRRSPGWRVGFFYGQAVICYVCRGAAIDRVRIGFLHQAGRVFHANIHSAKESAWSKGRVW